MDSLTSSVRFTTLTHNCSLKTMLILSYVICQVKNLYYVKYLLFCISAIVFYCCNIIDSRRADSIIMKYTGSFFTIRKSCSISLDTNAWSGSRDSLYLTGAKGYYVHICTAVMAHSPALA